MRVVVQRVKQASVFVNQKEIASISKGYLLYIGITDSDDEKIVEKMYLGNSVSLLVYALQTKGLAIK